MGFRGQKLGAILERREFQYVHGRTEVYFEVARGPTHVRTRSWGPARQEMVRELAFRSAARAKRCFAEAIEDALDRGFREKGTDEPYPWEPPNPTEGPLAVAALKKAVNEFVAPGLRARGFKGSFPKFHRVEAKRHCVVWFNWGRAGGHGNVGLAVLAARKGATAAQDYNRAHEPRTKTRSWLDELAKEEGNLFFFDSAAGKWGTDWPQKLALLFGDLLEHRGEAWFSRRGTKV